MKLAIASTTILFAMMTAQAAVLSATSTADVNLVKRAPNGGDDDEQSDMVGQSSLAPTSQDPLTEEEKDQVKNLYGSLCRELGELTREADPIPKEISKLKALITKLKEWDWETSPACTIANTEIAKLEEKLVKLQVQLGAISEEYKTKLHEQNGIKEARRLHDYNYLRLYLEDHLVEAG
ncbi:hypothetical protein BASA50_005044 [Batrachochytrium salamandrivorans]|uniref:RxLR effector protein n=1 Tax=Batrachochytrium salamandrivorans TaxID=1357716 RepID=A0ABQ8FDX0_9FUNG|nr:hypothetical protein BASA61_007618 [Batrachochytrium salamandrivorans]KAH6596559.1 hypothetical protein BASA50_005044 [Batrachochytrium salamandrivorans]